MENINTEIQEVDALTNITSPDQLETDPVEDDVPIMLTSEETVSYTGDYDAQILAELQESNDNWDLFLDSYTVNLTDTYTINEIKENELQIAIQSTGSHALVANTNSAYVYTVVKELPKGTYNIVINNKTTYQGPRFGIFNSTEIGETCLFNSYYMSNQVEEHTITFTTESTVYLIVTFSSSSQVSASSSARTTMLSPIITRNYTEQDSYTLSEIGNSLMQSKTNLDTCNMYMSILILILLFEICYKWIRNFGKFFNRKGDL